MDAEKIAKIRALAQHGATEGERAAAQAALERMGITAEEPTGSLGNQFLSSRRSGMTDEEIIIRLSDTIHLTKEDIDSFMQAVMGETVERSTKPQHGGRVWYDRS